MSETAEEFRERVRAKWRADKAKRRQAANAEVNAAARARNAAEAALRERFREEFDMAVLVARDTQPGPARQVHYRDAMKALRANHPDEWREALTQAKETM